MQKNFNALLIYILSGVILSAFGVQIFGHEVPCPLCYLQRVAMLLIALGATLNLCHGANTRYYALILFSSIAGGSVALRQISLHICPGNFPFGMPVLGLSLYTWSFLVFVCSVLFTGLMLLLFKPEEKKKEFNLFQKGALGLFIFVTTANIFTCFLQCGIGPCAD